MKIEFCMMCYLYQKRLTWLLSSIVQQKVKPDLIISIVSVRNNGNPTTEQIIDFYSKEFGLIFNHILLNDREELAYRGNIRNLQVEKCKSEWIYFSDTDYVFPPNFFEELEKILSRFSDPKPRRVISSRERINTEVLVTNDLVNSVNDLYIENVYEKASKIPVAHISNNHMAVGNMQIVRLKNIIANGGFYVKPEENKDRHMFKKCMKTASDIQFRHMMGGSKMFDLPNPIHLNHNRYNGYENVNEQR
jgi:hypothetical protein